jgi:hypothetical protein
MREVKWEPLNTEPHAHNADIPGSLYKFMLVLYSCLFVCINVMAFSHVFADVNVCMQVVTVGLTRVSRVLSCLEQRPTTITATRVPTTPRLMNVLRLSPSLVCSLVAGNVSCVFVFALQYENPATFFPAKLVMLVTC